jgi:hypothetical protein
MAVNGKHKKTCGSTRCERCYGEMVNTRRKREPQPGDRKKIASMASQVAEAIAPEPPRAQ